MDARKLTVMRGIASDSHARRVLLLAAAGVIAFTAAGVIIGWSDPAIAGHQAPHAVLTASFGDAISILAQNAPILLVPFLVAVFGYQRDRLERLCADLVVTVIAARSTVTVGVELGRWGGRLVPYIVQLPLEWAALVVSLSAWLLMRTNRGQRRHLRQLVVLTSVLLIAAAAVETYCTPHRAASSRPVESQIDLTSKVGDGGCFRSGFCAADGPIASRSHAPFPSAGSVPLGRFGGADRAHNNHRPPQGGITC